MAFDPRALGERPGGFLLPNPARDSRTFDTTSGRAVFTCTPPSALEVPEGQLILQTIRSHDQFNTTIYGYSDRLRGIEGTRDVLLMNPEEIARAGLAAGQRVALVTASDDGIERRVDGLAVTPFLLGASAVPPA